MDKPVHDETFVDASATTGTAELVPATSDEVQTWRIEIRFDFTGTKAGAHERAHAATLQLMREGAHGAEVTAIFDENWNEVDL